MKRDRLSSDPLLCPRYVSTQVTSHLMSTPIARLLGPVTGGRGERENAPTGGLRAGPVGHRRNCNQTHILLTHTNAAQCGEDPTEPGEKPPKVGGVSNVIINETNC